MVRRVFQLVRDKAGALTEYSTYRSLWYNSYEQLAAKSHQTPIVLVLATDWLGAVDVLDHYMEELSEQYKGKISFFRQNVERTPSIYQQIGIRELPTTILLKDGKLEEHFSGMISKVQIENKLMNLLAGSLP